MSSPNAKNENDMEPNTLTLKGRKPTAEEKRHMDSVAEMGCIVCAMKFIFNPAEIHHINGKVKEGCHFQVLPLCFEHHRKGNDKEPISRHPYKKRFESAYGTEKELLEKVNKLLVLVDKHPIEEQM
jgi:hypothetical protein